MLGKERLVTVKAIPEDQYNHSLCLRHIIVPCSLGMQLGGSFLGDYWGRGALLLSITRNRKHLLVVKSRNVL